MPGNPLVRFDEGRVGRASASPSLLLYLLNCRPETELGLRNRSARQAFLVSHQPQWSEPVRTLYAGRPISLR